MSSLVAGSAHIRRSPNMATRGWVTSPNYTGWHTVIHNIQRVQEKVQELMEQVWLLQGLKKWPLTRHLILQMTPWMFLPSEPLCSLYRGYRFPADWQTSTVRPGGTQRYEVFVWVCVDDEGQASGPSRGHFSTSMWPARVTLLMDEPVGPQGM